MCPKSKLQFGIGQFLLRKVGQFLLKKSDKENLFGIFLGVTHDIIPAELNIIVAINHPLASWLSQ
jgi:TM2 domain-containing membrane protein YozV